VSPLSGTDSREAPGGGGFFPPVIVFLLFNRLTILPADMTRDQHCLLPRCFSAPCGRRLQEANRTPLLPLPPFSRSREGRSRFFSPLPNRAGSFNTGMEVTRILPSEGVAGNVGVLPFFPPPDGQVVAGESMSVFTDPLGTRGASSGKDSFPLLTARAADSPPGRTLTKEA